MAIDQPHEPRRELPRPTLPRLQAMKLVLAACRDYRGEVITKGEHPLWLAVVALERLSRYTPANRNQTHRLDQPLDVLWWRGLWASRENMPNVPLEAGPGFYESFSTYNGPPEPKLAKAWIDMLAELLEYVMHSEANQLESNQLEERA